MPRTVHHLRALMLAVPAIACAEPTSAPAAAGPPPAPNPTPPTASPGRLLAIGDLHADLPAALAALSLAGLVDAEGRWIGGNAHLVQTGDITDRGPDSKELIELFDRLEEEAAAQGGRVQCLLGNHEVMNLVGDLRYVSPGDVADFGTPDARKQAFSAQGPLGAWLRGQDAVVVVDGNLFAHGGVEPEFANSGIANINHAVRDAIDRSPEATVLGPDGPLWSRDFVEEEAATACPRLAETLRVLGTTRMVVGHTTRRDGKIEERCDGRLLVIDTGISGHYGGHTAVLELTGGDARAIYPSGTVDLRDP
jgi:hypothetical protein